MICETVPGLGPGLGFRACIPRADWHTLSPMIRVQVIVFVLLTGFATAQDGGEAGTGPAVDQRDYPDSINGCAPATVLNLLRFGGAELARAEEALVGATDGVKMRFLVDRYFRGRPSAVFPGQPRWGLHGIEATDLAAGMRELFAEHHLAPCEAAYLDREEGEDEGTHLHRVASLIRDSIQAGLPPILNLRSFYVKRREENGSEPLWEAGVSHYVLVLALRTEPSTCGVELAILDPWRARRSVVYLHREANGRDFRALKGVAESGTWLSGRPFLQVLAPDLPTLRPADVEWSERYLVVANHLIGRFGLYSPVSPESGGRSGREETRKP